MASRATLHAACPAVDAMPLERTARGNRTGRYSALPLVLFYVVYWVVAIRTNLNIGHRCVKARALGR